jgi:hypothetical protein
MSFQLQKFDRLEMELLLYHFPKATENPSGGIGYDIKAPDLSQVVKDLGLKGREAMIQRAYSKFVREGLVARAGFGHKITDKGIEFVIAYKKLYSSM